MFQRLKGAIDSRIAEEQARQRASQRSPPRSNSSARLAKPGTASSSGRQSRSNGPKQDSKDSLGGEPDPSEFEKALIDDSEDGASRAEAPSRAKDKLDGSNPTVDTEDEKPPTGEEASPKEAPLAPVPQKPTTLPTDVRVKLRKLDKLEERYNELLRSYRIAHGRVALIDGFETALRENTPLTSINDPAALVEYLNQITLKSDMVMNELKRVTTERDDYKKKAIEAESSAREAWDEVGKLRDGAKSNSDEQDLSPSKEDHDSSDPVIAAARAKDNRVDSVLIESAGSLQHSTEDLGENETGEDIFSYDEELPRLKSELQDKDLQIQGLKSEIESLQDDLAVARESTEGMVQGLENATRELQMLRDQKNQRIEELGEQRAAAEEKLQHLERQLNEAEAELRAMKAERHKQAEYNSERQQREEQVERLLAEVTELRSAIGDHEKRVRTLNGLVEHLRAQLKDSEASKQDLAEEAASKSNATQELTKKVHQLEEELRQKTGSSGHSGADGKAEVYVNDGVGIPAATTPDTLPPSNGKKKSKKKKKTAKPGTDSTDQTEEQDIAKAQKEAATPEKEQNHKGIVSESQQSSGVIDSLQKELLVLHRQLEEKDEEIGRLRKKRKNEEDLREEVESLKENLIDVGQDYVASKDQIKQLESEKGVLEERLQTLEKEISDSGASHASSSAASEQVLKDLTRDFDELKATAATLQTDLSAAQQLAASRFKDLTTLKEVLQKAQPEISSLRAEVAHLRTAKEELDKKTTELNTLADKDLKLSLEISSLKKQLTERDAEMQKLSIRLKQETDGRLAAEKTLDSSQEALRTAEEEKNKLSGVREAMSKELSKVQKEVTASKSKIRDLELQSSRLEHQIEGLNEEIELKTAQHASAQSLMGSMRDQVSELATQMKEARERCDSLEEELGDAHRLLSERSRESETMRRLLADVEARADAKVREMRERMETAIEERDRAEEEASTMGRKRAREIEELKAKIRTAERDVRRAEDDRDELATAQQEWKKRREDLEAQAQRSAREVEDVRRALGELRDALDESETQARESEKHKADLRRELEERQDRLDKLRSSYKTLSDENRSLKRGRSKAVITSEAPSSRSSFESAPSHDRLTSPSAPGGRAAGNVSTTPFNGSISPNPASIDYVYLKNVLLQFLEQKDRKHQMQLVPVLGMLLHFDRKDEQRWMAAITTK